LASSPILDMGSAIIMSNSKRSRQTKMHEARGVGKVARNSETGKRCYVQRHPEGNIGS